MQLNANLEGIGDFIGAVEGVINAVESPDFKGDFIQSLSGRMKRKFMTDAIAANQSGYKPIKHVFEWGATQGTTTNVPLFAITRNKAGSSALNMSFKFLPSTEFVPLPDGRYGISSSVLTNLSRHVFVWKALVMETQSAVEIRSSKPRGLLIPDSSKKKGYFMTRKAVTINPGGEVSTGGFTEFWLAWFDGRGNQIAREYQAKAEQHIAKTGRKVIRYKAGTKINGVSVGGRYATGRGVSINYINGKSAAAEQMARTEFKREFNDSEDFEE